MSDFTMSTQVIGATELANALNSVDGYAKEVIKQAINKTAYDIQGKALNKAPHKTGALRDSIHVDQQPGHLAQVDGDNVTAQVGTDIVYARVQEYGTVGMTIHSRSRLGNPFSYVGNIQPKHYMRDASNESKDGFIVNMKKALSLIVQHVARTKTI